MAKQMQRVSRAEVAKHTGDGDAWIIINDTVYNVSKFAALHPGGELLLLQYAGQDATEDFYGLHTQSVLDKFGPRLAVALLDDAGPRPADDGLSAWGRISEVPYAESPFWRGWHSPYYNESHDRLRRYVRAFYDKEVREVAQAGEDSHTPPTSELMQKVAAAGLLHTQLGPGPHLKMGPMPAGLTPETFDYFHSCVLHEEAARLQAPGWMDGLYSGFVISAPALMHFGTEKMRREVVPDLMAGRKWSCLAITEAFAGSDVANIRTTAVKSADGTHYIVNGTKKWITNGTFAEYFVTAVRTGGPGAGGLSMLLIPRCEGVETKIIKTNYSHAAGTSYVTFENVKVPVENLMGQENEGLRLIVNNFNLERLHICQGVIPGARFIVEECFKWANQRKVFGKALIQQPVIREKLGRMVADVESVHAYLELIVYQMQNMPFEEQNTKLGGAIALLKYQTTEVSSRVASDAVQIFGGRGATQTGMGRAVSIFYRTNVLPKVYGGSSEIMADLGVRQALKSFPRDAKL